MPREVIDSIHVGGIRARSYSAEEKAKMDAANPHVVDWDRRMRTLQQTVPATGPDGTWIDMERVFRFTEHRDTDGKTG